MNRRARVLAVPGLLLLGLLCYVLYAYPGLMSIDSIDQLSQARDGFYTDAHPPAMAALWRLFDRIVAGPFLMLLLQGTTFLAGSYMVLSRALSPWKAALAASLVLLFPPVIAVMAFIWKDSLMAGVLMLAIGLVMSSDRRMRLASLACFALAIAVKYNAFAATLPLIVLLFEWMPGRRAIQRYTLAAAVWLGLAVAAFGVNVALTDQPMHFWHSSLAVADIVGVINYEDDTSDAQLQQALRGTGLRVTHGIQARARALYATHEHLKIVLGPRSMWDLPTSGTVPAPEEQRNAIAAAWWRMVSDHPAAYARHRLDYFLAVLGVTFRYREMPHPVDPRMLENLDLATTPAAYQLRWRRFNNWYWQHTPLFRQWIYFVIAVVLLVVGRRQRDVVALLASGVVIEMSLLFLAPSPDYRYSHWTIVVTILAAIMMLQRARDRVRADRRGTSHGEPNS